MRLDVTTDPVTSIRTEATHALLQQVDAALNQWRKLPFNDALNGPMLGQTCRDLDRAWRQFCRTFIVGWHGFRREILRSNSSSSMCTDVPAPSFRRGSARTAAEPDRACRQPGKPPPGCPWLPACSDVSALASRWSIS